MGTRFEISIPRIAANAQAQAQAPDDEPCAHAGETVLVVEDESMLRHVVRETLESFGYRVLEASDASTALEIADRAEERIDVILTDVVMPRLTGREVAARVRARRPAARVLFISGYADDALKDEDLRCGPVALLHKPFSSSSLARRLRDLLDAP